MKRERAREWTLGLYRRYLPGEPDAYASFLRLIESSCPPGGRVADLGCGEEGYLSFLLPRAGEIVGVDGRPLRGPYARYLQADLDLEIPLAGESVDLAVGKFLLEHLENPRRFLRSVHRILRPGGHVVLMTTNVFYYPYALNYLLSRLLSQRTRMRLVRFLSGRAPGDIFPVRYRCNTPRRLRTELEEAGFEVVHLSTYSDCLVSAVTRPLGVLAVAYERAVGRLRMQGARGFIVAAGRRKRGEGG